jgi:hypothetical protein
MVSKFTEPNTGTIAANSEKLDGPPDLDVFPSDDFPI